MIFPFLGCIEFFVYLFSAIPYAVRAFVVLSLVTYFLGSVIRLVVEK